MHLLPISRCNRCLNFSPRSPWPEILPACVWRGLLVCGFDKPDESHAVSLDRGTLVEAVKACYPQMGLAELARLIRAMRGHGLSLFTEFREPLCNAYGLRWNARLEQTLDAVAHAPLEFQNWVDEKKLGARDVACLLALQSATARTFDPFLSALAGLTFSKSDGVRALELGLELFLLGHPLSDLLPTGAAPPNYLRRLEEWRRPRSAQADREWSEDVGRWPWPAHVQGEWRRFGDQSGLEIQLRATSPDELAKTLERLETIRDTWSCKS